MKRKISIITLILVCASFFLMAQHLEKMEKMEKKAQKAFYKEDFKGAIDAYNDVLAYDSKHKLAQYRLAICSLVSDYRTLPIDNILAYRKTQGRKDKFFNYWLGRIYFQQNNFKKAIETWNSFLKSGKYYSSEIRGEVEEFIKWAELANEQYNHPRNYEIEQLSEVVNSPFTEYSPVYFKEKDELLFLSDKNSAVLGENFEIYHSYRENEKWSEPTAIKSLGTFSENNANIEVVGEGGKLYMYKDQNYRRGDLYYSEEKGGHHWEEGHKVEGAISSVKLESHFFINEQEDRILFAHRTSSKIPNLDIFESRLDATTGKWSKPELLSADISSQYDEDYPFLTHDGKTLYFSSKGFNTLGKYDVYKSIFDDTTGKWSTPESLKYPVNSTDNDIQFKVDESTNSGYFVSDRFDTYGEYDVFFFHESAKVIIEGQVVDGAGKPVDHAQIQFFSSRETGLVVKTMTGEDGEYNVRVGNDDDVRIDIYFHDEKVHTQKLRTPHAEGAIVKMSLDFDISKEKKEPEVVLSEHVDPQFVEIEDIGSKFRESKKAKLSNIYFDFGKANLNVENHAKLSGLLEALKEYPKLQLEIAGHTDNVGESDFNLKLSQERAESVVNYLISNGIEGSRLVPKGYGDTQPLASNDDEKDGRELNRRIEVVVIE